MLTQDGLKALAARLGLLEIGEFGERLGNNDRFPGTKYWGGEFLYGGGGGTRFVHWSDGDLLLAILNRAIEMQLRLKLNAGNFQGMAVKHNADRLWSAEFETYAHDGNGPRVKGASAPTVLEAVILAFLQVPNPSAGG